MKRVDVMVDLAVIAASIGVAIVIHRPVVHCSYRSRAPTRMHYNGLSDDPPARHSGYRACRRRAHHRDPQGPASAPRIGVVPTGPVSRNHGETQAALEQCHDDRSAGQRHDMRATSDSL